MDQLKEHPQIVELLDTLDKNGLMKEKNEVQSLVSYIGGMEETLTGMLGELQDMRREINLIHNNTLRSKCHTLVEKTESKIRQGFSAVKKMKDNLIQSAGNAVRAFREKGRDAIAESVRAMKIPEALDKLSAMFGRMSKEMAQDTKKLSAMQAELQGAKGQDVYKRQMCELYDYVENTEFPPEMVSSLMKTKNVLELSWDEWMMNIEVDDMEDSIEKVAELLRERKI